MQIQSLSYHDSFVKCFDLACSQSTGNNSSTLTWWEIIVLDLVIVSVFENTL